MTTGTKKEVSILLKAAVVLCVLFAFSHLVEFAFSHIPPFKAGQCLETPKPLLNLKIDENHIMQGYSDVEIQILGRTEAKGPVAFDDLRNPAFKLTECQTNE